MDIVHWTGRRRRLHINGTSNTSRRIIRTFTLGSHSLTLNSFTNFYSLKRFLVLEIFDQ